MQQPASAPHISSGPLAQAPFGRGGFTFLLLFSALLLGYGYAFLQVSAYETGITRQSLTITGCAGYFGNRPYISGSNVLSIPFYP